MYAQDFDRFRKVMDTLAELFGKAKLSDEALGAYWEALKDLHIAAVEREAQRHGRYGKFFPKPVELRPKDDKPPEPIDEKSLAASTDAAVASWEKLRMENPKKFWRQFANAYLGRLEFRFVRGSPEYWQSVERCLSRCNYELERLGEKRIDASEIDTGIEYRNPDAKVTKLRSWTV